jgi:hypothetical protein
MCGSGKGAGIAVVGIAPGVALPPGAAEERESGMKVLPESGGLTIGAGAGGAGGGEGGGEEGVSGVGGGDPGSDGGVGGGDPGSDDGVGEGDSADGGGGASGAGPIGVGPIGAGEGGADLPSLSSTDLSPGLSTVDPSPSLGETGVADKDGGPAGAAPGNIEGSGTLGVGVGAGEDDISGPGAGGADAESAGFLSRGSIRDVPLPEGAEGVGDPEDVEVGEGLSSEDFFLSAPAEDR